MAMPCGELNEALVPVPLSVLPEEPVPANVVVTPVDITTFRIKWFAASAIYIFVPVLSIAMPAGLLNRADVAGPEPVLVLPAVSAAPP